MEEFKTRQGVNSNSKKEVFLEPKKESPVSDMIMAESDEILFVGNMDGEPMEWEEDDEV